MKRDSKVSSRRGNNEQGQGDDLAEVRGIELSVAHEGGPASIKDYVTLVSNHVGNTFLTISEKLIHIKSKDFKEQLNRIHIYINKMNPQNQKGA